MPMPDSRPGCPAERSFAGSFGSRLFSNIYDLPIEPEPGFAQLDSRGRLYLHGTRGILFVFLLFSLQADPGLAFYRRDLNVLCGADGAEMIPYLL
jgi:hypothetical protein